MKIVRCSVDFDGSKIVKTRLMIIQNGIIIGYSFNNNSKKDRKILLKAFNDALAEVKKGGKRYKVRISQTSVAHSDFVLESKSKDFDHKFSVRSFKNLFLLTYIS